jgi:hypothetical protein
MLAEWSADRAGDTSPNMREIVSGALDSES